jgi:CO/xanthine dehydrogenase Mo-binding subunit
MTMQRTATAPLVGTSATRLDGAAKAAGTFEYGVDASLPGMLYAKVRRSEQAHARILSVDTSRAVAMPGVHAVVTGADIGDCRASRYVRDEPVLAKDRVRYHGEPIAVVAADSEAIAEAAAQQITVEYEPLPVVLDPEQALRPDAPLIHPEWESYWAAPTIRRNGNILSHATLERGDVDGIFATAAHVFENRYRTHMVHQASLEGRVAIADVDSDGHVHVISSHQFPFGLRQDLSDILHIPVEKIRVTLSGLGGGFGGKLYAGVETYCVLLSSRTGRPVRLAHTREEELIATSPRMAAVVDVRTAVDESGRLLAREGTIHYDAGAYSESSPSVVSIGLLTLPGPYNWQALRINTYAVYTNKANCGSYRGPGAPPAVFAGETQVDLIADQLGLDPLEIRLRNAVVDGDLGPSGQVLRNVSLKETLQAAADRIGWDEPRRPQEGLGIACCWWTTTGGPSSAYLTLDPDGTVVMITGASEIGTGAVQAGVAQICADEFGVGLDRIRIAATDTSLTPYDFGAQGSRTTFQMGNAVLLAASDLKRQLVELAAGRLDCEVGELEFVDGAVSYRSGAGACLTLAELASLNWQRGPEEQLVGRGSYIAPGEEYDETTLTGSMATAMQAPSFSTHAAKVEVDLQTGEPRLRRYVAAQDVGFAINPLYASGQVTGGAAQGIGYAMFEEIKYQDGVVLNPNFTDYKLPTTVDLPKIESILIENSSEHGPYGAKGVGEPSVVPSAAAIASAVHDAAGVWIDSLPITAERVHRALSELQKEQP